MKSMQKGVLSVAAATVLASGAILLTDNDSDMSSEAKLAATGAASAVTAVATTAAATVFVGTLYPLFIEALWRGLAKFPYQRVTNHLTIIPSHLENAALLGAAHLYLQSKA